MANTEVTKLLYIVVGEPEKDSFRYTRSVLQSTLQLMGCKPRHAFKVLLIIFLVLMIYYMDNSIFEKNTSFWEKSASFYDPITVEQAH